MSNLQIEIPEPLREELERRVHQREFKDVSAAVAEALRYYLERHRQEDWEEYVRKEVEWSRRGVG